MISERIKTIASLIKNANKIADVGCDHGYLIIECFNNYNVNDAIAIDNKYMPLESAKHNINLYNKYNNKNVRYSLSSGINDVDADTDAVVIAGMGGSLIINILKDGFSLNGLPYYKNMKFILQANRNVSELRKFLNENCFEIINEKVVYDDKKYYEIIVCQYLEACLKLTDIEIEFGPILLKNKDEVFINYYNHEIKKLEKIVNDNTNSITKKIERIKNICL